MEAARALSCARQTFGWVWFLASLFGLACGGATTTTTTTTGDQQSEASPAAPGPAHAPEVMTAIELGHALFFGRAMCSTCHRVHDEGTMIVGPNLGVGDEMTEPFAVRVSARGVDIDPPVYAIESILDPNAIIVPGYARSVMKSPDDIPVELSDDELVALAAFVISIGAREPVTADMLARARAHIPAARASRHK
jgi:hypothetical protein